MTQPRDKVFSSLNWSLLVWTGLGYGSPRNLSRALQPLNHQGPFQLYDPASASCTHSRHSLIPSLRTQMASPKTGPRDKPLPPTPAESQVHSLGRAACRQSLSIPKTQKVPTQASRPEQPSSMTAPGCSVASELRDLDGKGGLSWRTPF